MAEVRVIIIERDELLRLIGDAVRAAGAAPPMRDEWVDARSSGLGRRLFLRLAREGAFPVSKRGNAHVARRSDLDAYLERQRVRPTPPPSSPEPQSPTVDDPIASALAAGRLRIIKNPR